jgi:hypothetical protein
MSLFEVSGGGSQAHEGSPGQKKGSSCMTWEIPALVGLALVVVFLLAAALDGRRRT